MTEPTPWHGEPRPPFPYRPLGLTVRDAPPAPPKPRWGLALFLFALTFVSTTTMGAVWMLYTSTREVTELPLFLLPSTFARVWGDPELLRLGLGFAVPSLLILLCHETGHYVACRRYRLPATLPYFLPFPLGLGTLGAFIRIRAAIRSKRVLFDVGVAGPIAGFVVLVPFLAAGVAWSEPVELATLPPGVAGVLLVPGQSLALAGLTELFHGSLGADRVLQLHPFALAGWLGLLATSLNLIPLGQLDGGHVLYAALGKTQRRLAVPLWLGLLAVAVFLWVGWILWCLVTLAMGLHHPPVRDEDIPLDPRRRGLGLAALGIFAASFMPVPIQEVLILPAGGPDRGEGVVAGGGRSDVQHEGHRAVVDQIHLHPGAEAAGLDAEAGLAEGGHQLVHHRLGHLRRSGAVEGGSAAPVEGAGQGELGDDQELGAGPDRVQVHPAPIVLEDTQVGELRRRGGGPVGAVLRLDSHQDEEAGADPPHGLAVHANLGSRHPLQDQTHRFPSCQGRHRPEADGPAPSRLPVTGGDAPRPGAGAAGPL